MAEIPGYRQEDGCWFRSGKLVAIALPWLGLLVASALVLLAIWTDVDARPEGIQRDAKMSHGAYLLTQEGTVRLYQWHMPLSDLPCDCPSLDATDLRAILVVTGQPLEADAYHLHHLQAGAEAAWRSVERDGEQFLLDPGPLAPGGYLLTMPTHDLFGSKTYHYFRLE
ncbi:MAG: hypothetical protein ACK2UC_07370 [Anaerolineae bacterium]